MYIDKDKPQPPVVDKKDPVGVVLEAFIENDRKVQEVTGDFTDTLNDINDNAAVAQTKLDQFTAAATAKLKVHTNKTGAIHGENKDTVGLGNKDNWPMATMEQHLSGEDVNAYAHPAGLRAMVEQRVKVDPSNYIPARVIPYSSGGMIGDIPQYHHDVVIGELVQSEENPLKYLGDTPWEFSTSSGALIFPTLNNAPKQGRYTQTLNGIRPFLHSPLGGSKIRVYNKTLDMRRTRPTFIRGWSASELGTFTKPCTALMDNSSMLYREEYRWLLRSFNKNVVPIDYADITGYYSNEPTGTFEYAEGWLYNFNSVLEHRAVPGSPGGAPTEIYARFNMRAFKFTINDYLNSDGPGKMMEQNGVITANNVNYTASLLPSHNKLEFFSAPGSAYGSIFVRLKNLLNLPAGIETELMKNISQELTGKPLISWKNRMSYHYVVRIGLGWHNKTKTKYWHTWLDFEVIDRPATVAGTSQMRIYTLDPIWDGAKQTLNANFDVTGVGMFKEYAPTIKENGLHPLALGGVFESLGGHIKTYTLYGRQYVTYYQHPYGKIADFQLSGNGPVPLPTQQEFNSQSTLNSNGMYGDHLRHIPISIDQKTGLTTYLVHLRDHRHRYRWGRVEVDSAIDYVQNRDHGNYMGAQPKNFEWLSGGFAEPPSFVIYNDDYQAEMDINGLVFHGGNNYVGFANYTYDPGSLSTPIEVGASVVLDNEIVAWLTANVGSWSNPDIYVFYFRKALFWMVRCTKADQYPADGKDCFYGVIKDCEIRHDAIGNMTMTSVRPIAESIVINKMNLYTKASLMVDTSAVFGFDGLNERDLYIQMVKHNTDKTQDHDVMINMGPFNNFYIEMTLTHNLTTNAVTFGPKVGGSDQVFPYDPTAGFQIDYDTHILYGTKLPHRMHINYQSPVMLKRGMWSYRKTPNNFGVSTRRHGFLTITGGLMAGYEGVDVYPIGSVLTIAGKNTVVRKPIQLTLAEQPAYNELFVRMDGANPVLYGTKLNPDNYELEPHNGAAAAGWMAGTEFYYYDPASWRNSFLPVVDNRRMSPYGYGGTFPFFFGKAGEGIPYNRYWLDLPLTKITWDTSKGRTVPTMSVLPVVVKVDGVPYSTNGQQSFQIPATHTGMVSLEISYLQTIKWARGMTTLTQIGGEVRKLDFSDSETFGIIAPLPRWITSLDQTFIRTTAISFPGLESWNVSLVETMVECFKDAPNFNQKLNWQLGNCNDISGMFRNTGAFNQNVDNFSCEKVKTAAYCFADAKAFNLPIKWNLMRCTSLRGFFQNAKVFNSSVVGLELGTSCDLSEFFMGTEVFNTSIDTWDLSQAVSLQDMFNGSKAFNRPLNLTLGQCRNVIQMFYANPVFNSAVNLNLPVCTAFNRMFQKTKLFNQKLPAWSFIGGTTLEDMFREAAAYNQGMDHWMMERVESIRGILREAKLWNQPIRTWKFYKLRDAAYCFSGSGINSELTIDWPVDPNVEVDGTGIFYLCYSFNQPVEHWNMSRFTVFNGIFNNALAFNQPVNNWNVSAAISLQNLFKRARAFNQPLDKWNVGKAVAFDHMFEEADVFDQDISMWDVGSGVNFTSMFSSALKFSKTLSVWDMGNAATTALMFNGCVLFNSPINDWDVSKVTDMHDMFSGCVLFNQPLDKWNVGNVQYFNGMFKGCTAFDQDLSMWDVSNGIDFASMFRDAVVYNKPMADWETDNATNFASMFKGAFEFNQPIGGWNTANVTNMAYMFDAEPDFTNTNSAAATKFNQDISGWNTSNVTSIRAMFRGAEQYNRPMNNWDTTNVTNMSEVFNRAHAFNQDLDNWKTDKVTTIGWMFYGCTVFNGKVNNWNTSNVLEATGCFQYAEAFDKPLTTWRLPLCTSIASMFYGAIKFNQPLNDLDVSGNLTLQSVFQDAAMFNQPLDKWDVSKVTSFLATFSGAAAFNQPLTAWDVSKGTVFANMFRDATMFNGAVNNWNTISATNMTGMFSNAKAFDGDISGWNVSKVTNLSTFALGASEFKSSMSAWNVGACTNFTSMFAYCPKFNSPLNIWNMTKATSIKNMFSNATIFNQPLANWNLAVCTDFTGVFSMAQAFNQDLSLWNVNKATTFQDMFYGATAYNKPMSSWVTGACTNFSGMFREAVAFNQNITSWNVGAGTDFSSMFYGAAAFNQPLSTWNLGNGVNFQDMFRDAILANPTLNTWNVSKGVNFSGMFYGAAKLVGLPVIWNMANATNLSNMFRGCTLFNADLSGWNVSKVTDMSWMFQDATAFNGDISGWVTTALTKMDGMFYGANAFNRDISNWDISQVTSLADVFRNAKAFNSPLANWNVSNVTTLAWTFSGASLFNQDLSTWDVSKVTDMRATFNACTKFNGNIENWNTIACTDTRWMFQDAKEFAGSLSTWKLGNVVSLAKMFSGAGMFNGDISGWDVSKSTSFQGTFSGCTVFNRPIGSWNVSKSIDFSEMFYMASAFNQNLDEWDTSKATTIANIFYLAEKFNGDVSTWNVSNVTDFSKAFMTARAFAGDISNWNVSKGVNFERMFHTTDLFNSQLSLWRMPLGKIFTDMFYGAKVFNQPIGDWDVSSATGMSGMFRGSLLFNQPIGGWNTANVTNMGSMFRSCRAFNQDLSMWSVAKVTNHEEFATDAPQFTAPKPAFIN